jgi:aminopeptidase
VNAAERVDRLADLAVSVGANVQPGQLVVVGAQPEHLELVRAIARSAYRAGARYVAGVYDDLHVKRALVELGPEESLSNSMPWDLAMLDTLVSERGAYLRVSGDPDPDLMTGLDPARVGKAQYREFRARWGQIVSHGDVAWTIVPLPTAGWAKQVFGKPDVEALWTAVIKALRLDRPDPAAAWKAHFDRLRAIASAIDERHFDSLHYQGPGTDFTVGLLPSGRWHCADFTTSFGQNHAPNLPTEEVFTSPDRRRAEGKIRSTLPLNVPGTMVRDLQFEFRDGRIVNVSASSGVEVVRAQLAMDENAVRLGEIALVDGSSEVGKLGVTFCNTLFDENATCHIAYGSGMEFCIEDPADVSAGLNHSAIHTDFMVGGPEVQVDGIDKRGSRVTILKDNEFRVS